MPATFSTETASVPGSREQLGPQLVDVVVVGGGQAGLAAGFYLRRAGLAPGAGYLVLDDAGRPGGAWPRMWPSLRLFSPPEYASLPGWLMPAWTGGGFPPARHVVEYLAAYERRYQLPVRRSVRVTAVRRADSDPGGRLLVQTTAGTWAARAVICATGTWTRPFVPHYPGMAGFAGRQLHTAQYRTPEPFDGQRVAVVGGGNSAAQLLAEVSEVATARRRALDAGQADTGGVAGLGDIVMVPAVKDARARGVLAPRPPFARRTRSGLAWADGTEQPVDAILWCTGFRPALGHLAPLRLRDRTGRIATDGTRAVGEPRLHLLGYGDWTGPASATLIGVGRTARDAVADLTARLGR